MSGGTAPAAVAEIGGAPCFSASSRGGALRTCGPPTGAFGHRLPRTDGGDDGVHAAWHWDGATLTAGNDRYGMQPLYYCATPDAVWISPSIVALVAAGAPTDFDWDGLAVFLRLGYFLAEDTPFAHIRALPPGATLRWRPGGVAVEGGLFLRRAAPLARAAAVDGYIDLFRAAIRRRLSESPRVALPLSGGRDSRHILLELCAQGRPPAFCVTARHYPPRADEDARVAALLTTALDLPHVLLDQSDRFAAERRKNLLTDFCADEHAWAMVLADTVNAGADALYDGVGGDVLSAGLFLTPARQALCDAGRFAALAADLLSTGSETTLVVCLRADVRARLGRERALRRVAAELARHGDAANPIGSFIFWNRTRREVGLVPYGLFGAVRQVFAPYLDHDLYDFLAALPVGLLLDQELHSEVIRRAHPAFAAVPFEVRGAGRRDARPQWRAFLRRLTAYARAPGAPPPRLTRAAAAIAAGGALAQHLAEWRAVLRPELLLYLVQLERLAAGDAG